MRYSGIFMDVTAALTEAGLRHGQEPFTGEWPDNKWLNTPGPIYCGMTDNCYTGPLVQNQATFSRMDRCGSWTQP
jgi:hypothetical protein